MLLISRLKCYAHCTLGTGPWHTSRYRSIVASLCGAYHLMTSACFGEYFIMDPYTNTGVFAHLVIIEDEDFNE